MTDAVSSCEATYAIWATGEGADAQLEDARPATIQVELDVEGVDILIVSGLTPPEELTPDGPIALMLPIPDILALLGEAANG